MNRLEELKNVELGEKIGYKKGFEAARKQFERPRGEWTSNGNDLEYICSVCGEDLPYSDEYDYQTNFCPNCGAPMNEEAFKKYNGLEEGEQNEWRKF